MSYSCVLVKRHTHKKKLLRRYFKDEKGDGVVFWSRMRTCSAVSM